MDVFLEILSTLSLQYLVLLCIFAQFYLEYGPTMFADPKPLDSKVILSMRNS